MVLNFSITRIEQIGLIELRNCVVEIEFFEHLAHIVTEAIDICFQICCEVGCVSQGVSRSHRGMCYRRHSQRLYIVVARDCRVSLSGDLLISNTRSFVGCSTQSMRRSTVSGRIISWYLLRLKVSRSRSATLQIKLTLSLKLFICYLALSLPSPTPQIFVEIELCESRLLFHGIAVKLESRLL